MGQGLGVGVGVGLGVGVGVGVGVGLGVGVGVGVGIGVGVGVLWWYQFLHTLFCRYTVTHIHVYICSVSTSQVGYRSANRLHH